MDSLYNIKPDSVDDTLMIAGRLAKYLKPGNVITLEGDLGAGKTVFTQGLAKGLGINQIVNSPTFVIIKEYQGKMPLYHMDVYRLKEGIEDLGFDEYFYGNGITVVEWAHIIKDYLPEEYLNIKIIKLDDNIRNIIFEPYGNKYLKIYEEFVNNENFSY